MTTLLLGANTTIDAGLEIATVVAILALLVALVGVPRRSAPTCRRCGADLRPILLPATPGGDSAAVRCTCGNAVDRRGGVRWRGTCRVRWLLALALVIGAVAAGARAWSHGRATRDLVWTDLLPTAWVVQAIEGTRSTPWWVDQGGEWAEVRRRVRVGVASEDEVRSLLLMAADRGAVPGSPEWMLAVDVLGHGPASARAPATAIGTFAPALRGPRLGTPTAFLVDADRVGQVLQVPMTPQMLGGGRPMHGSDDRVVRATVHAAGRFPVVRESESSIALGSPAQVFAARSVRVGGRELWNDEAQSTDGAIQIVGFNHDGLPGDPSLVLTQGSAALPIAIADTDLGGQVLEIELVIAVVDRMTADAIVRAEWTARDLADESSGVQAWTVILSAPIEPVGAAEGPR